jgi:sn-glycerol 3-phosphate transport system ATP-binding protein
VVNDLEPAERDIAMVFQNYALYPHMSVFDNMAYGLKIAKVPKAEIKARVDKAAKILELGHLLERKPRELSGGQRQRVAMGRAIVRQPQVFLFDEPLSNLDAKLRAQTRLEIQKLHRELGITSLFVTHDQVEAMTLAQRMIVMNAGRMEQFGTPEEVYGTPGVHLRGQLHRLAADEPAAGQADGSRAATWPLKVEVLEMLGAERLVYGRLGDAHVHRAHRRTLPPPPGEAPCTLHVAAPHLHWFDASTGQRVDGPARCHPAWPCRCWIAHRGAGKLAPENTLAAFRLGAPTATAPSNATSSSAPTACPSCCTTPRWSAPPAARAWAATSPGRRCRSWTPAAGTAAPCRRAAAHAGGHWRASCLANGLQLNIEIKPTPGQERATGPPWPSRRAGCGRAGRAAAAQFLPARGAAGRTRHRAAPAARAAARQPVAGCLDVAAALGCVAVVTNHTLMDAALMAKARQAGCAGLCYTVNDPPTPAPAGAGHRRADHRRGRPLRARVCGRSAVHQPLGRGPSSMPARVRRWAGTHGADQRQRQATSASTAAPRPQSPAPARSPRARPASRPAAPRGRRHQQRQPAHGRRHAAQQRLGRHRLAQRQEVDEDEHRADGEQRQHRREGQPRPSHWPAPPPGQHPARPRDHVAQHQAGPGADAVAEPVARTRCR